MITPLDYFALLVAEDQEFPLLETTFAIAQPYYPQLDLLSAQIEVDAFTARIRRRAVLENTPVQKLRLLNQFFYDELGFCCNANNYYDPDNNFIHRVISTRRGIPITLGLLYMELGQHLGLDLKGIIFPEHFLLKLSISSGDIVIDPSNGESLSREMLEDRLNKVIDEQSNWPDFSLSACLSGANERQIISELLHNLKRIYSSNTDWPALLPIHERLVILLPDDLNEKRDRGLTHAQLEQPQEAMEDIEAYLAEFPHAKDAPKLRTHIKNLLRQASKRPH